jgi:23S rRNA (adenine2503-C2)-methyltransferase
MRYKRSKNFANGTVYALETYDGFPVETTDTFLPWYTRDAIARHQNALNGHDPGSRSERWMIGVSVMSGCPVRCRFCATGQLKRWRNLTAEEIVAQVDYVIGENAWRSPGYSREFKINYTRMGEPFLNIEEVKRAIRIIDDRWPGVHHYVSTIGIAGSDFSWVRDNITLQVSLHSLDDARRDWLIPYKNKLTVAQLGAIRTDSDRKTTLNMTLTERSDFDIRALKRLFDRDHFFVKLSPINPNAISEKNNLGSVVEGINLV